METQNKVIRKYRARRPSDGPSSLPQSVNTVLLKVKRSRDSEPVEEVEFEFDKESGTLKRQKFVTEQQALVSNFENQFSFKEEKKDNSDIAFSIGSSKQANSTRVVKLRKLTTPSEFDETKVKQASLDYLNNERKKRREEALKKSRPQP